MKHTRGRLYPLRSLSPVIRKTISLARTGTPWISYRDMDPPPDLREFHRLKEFSLAAYWEMFSHVHPYPNCLLEPWLGYDPLALAYCLEDRSELWYNENSLSGFAQYEDNISSSPVGRVLVNKGCINYHPPLPPGTRVEKTLIYEG